MDWTCSHCGKPQASTNANESRGFHRHSVGEFSELKELKRDRAAGIPPATTPCLSIRSHVLRCTSQSCQKLSVHVIGVPGYKNTAGTVYEDGFFALFSSNIYPLSHGRPFPEYIPDSILEDYREAWSIIELSPKSSATLARRCLQSMIRDFCGIRESTLYLEIKKLEKLLADDKLPKGVESETIEAMKAVKDVGNHGAHMNVVDGCIVEVDPNEAKSMLSLVEMLFNDWYIAKGKRQKVLSEIVSVAKSKEAGQSTGSV